jgi:dTDP-4-amino-4,6-dideoxygalactose transaminase
MSTGKIVFGEPWFGEEEIELVTRTVRSRWIGQGPLVDRFERDLERYLGASDAVAVSSCTAALHLSLVAAGVGPGDEVITTPLTFVATVNAIEYVGATPRLVDIDPETLLLRPEDVAAALTERTKAVIPVSFGGRPLDVEGYLRLLDETDLWVIEDAAHSIGAVAGGRMVGADRHPRYLTCFSFYPNKNLASAEGGAITTSDEAIAHRLRSIRLHGLDADAWARYRVDTFQPSLAVDCGYKYNWTDLQAALALPQLERLEGFMATREFLATGYDRLVERVPCARPIARPTLSLTSRHALHLYQVRVPGRVRNQVVEHMRTEGLGAAVHYIGVNLHPRFDRLAEGPLPHADAASHELVSLPLHPGLHVDELERVVTGLEAALARFGASSPASA